MDRLIDIQRTRQIKNWTDGYIETGQLYTEIARLYDIQTHLPQDGRLDRCLKSRQIDRQIDRQIGRQIDRQIDRQLCRQTEECYIDLGTLDKFGAFLNRSKCQVSKTISQTDIGIYRQKYRQIDRISKQTQRNIATEIHRQMDTQMNRQIDRQKDRQRDRQVKR